MVVGTICYATESGLGRLAREFVRHNVVQRILVMPHGHFINHPEWYGSEGFTPNEKLQFLEGLDVILLFEQMYDVSLLQLARKKGIKIILMPMYECTPARLPIEMDGYICPSELDLQHYRARGGVYIPVPVAQKWRQRDTACLFVHNAGHGGLDYRNGTPELLEALKYLKSDARFIVRGQPHCVMLNRLFRNFQGDPRVTLTIGDVPEAELWATGDVFVFPEKFNGLSLPMQEAYASGMLVMGSNRFPMNNWLPKEPLIPVNGYTVKRMAVNISSAVIDPKQLAAHIDNWYGKSITDYSQQGKQWAQEHSWDALRPRYQEYFAGR